MKTAAIPALQIDHELRQAAEDSLDDGATLGSFVEQSIREAVDRRRHQRDIAFGSSAYVALFEIADNHTVTVLAVRHQRGDDYHL